MNTRIIKGAAFVAAEAAKLLAKIGVRSGGTVGVDPEDRRASVKQDAHALTGGSYFDINRVKVTLHLICQADVLLPPVDLSAKGARRCSDEVLYHPRTSNRIMVCRVRSGNSGRHKQRV
jgi:hypothetical protein